MALGPGLGTGDPAEVRILLISVGRIELRCIRNVEALSAELQLDSFREREILEDGEIKGSRRRSGVALQANIALGKSLAKR